MPNWNQPFDLYNNTCDNFNPWNITHITKELMDKYFPYDICQECMLQFERPSRICFGTDICKLRTKDNGPCKTFVLTKGSRKKDSRLSLTIRTGNLVWLYKNKVPFILRACNENGLELHHKNGNPYNNRWYNVVLVDKHAKIHGELRRVSKVIESLIFTARKFPEFNKDIYNSIKKLQITHKNMAEGVKDSPRVFKIIDIVTQVLRGTKPIYDAQRELEDIEAAFSSTIVENYDLRKVKGKQKQIIDFERQKGKNNAIQNVQQLVI